MIELSELAAERSVLDERLAAAVKTLSSEALDANSTRFLELADSRLSGYVRPLKDSLERIANSRAWSESGRRPTASSPRTSACCEAIMIASASRPETSSPPCALRTSAVAGERSSLKRVIEMAGMIEHCDFDEQRRRATRTATY